MRAVKLLPVETYSHAFFTWILAKHGLKAGRAAAVAGAVGAALPDVPAVVGVAYLWNRRNDIPVEQFLNAVTSPVPSARRAARCTPRSPRCYSWSSTGR